jgi:hypothetical protein
MAYKAATIAQVRAHFVYDRWNLHQIARKMRISYSTLSRLKSVAKRNGDDWDKARVANTIAGEGAQAVAVKFMEDFMMLLNTTIDDVKRRETDLKPQERVDALARLADAYNKAMAAVKRTLPDLSELAVAMEVLQHLAKFVQSKYPQHAGAFSEILEPFGAELAKKFG